MPKDKKDSKKGAKKKSATDTPSINTLILKKLLTYYQTYSIESNSKPCPDMVKGIKLCLENDTSLTKVLLRPIPKDKRAENRFNQELEQAQLENNWELVKQLKIAYCNPPATHVHAFMQAASNIQLATVKEMYIFDLPFLHKDMIELVKYLRLVGSPIKRIELLDCLITADAVSHFATCLNYKSFLTEIILDYNEFGDKGCVELCKGLTGNRTVLSLSLNYCNLGSQCGAHLGRLLHTTALRDLYLDGNDLRCQGAIDLIKDIVLNAEAIELQKQLEEQMKIEEEKRLAEEEAKKPMWERNAAPPASAAAPEETKEEDKKKKKKKKKGKKKKSKEPPPVGSFVYKLHLADNAIDIYENGANRIDSYNIMHQTIEMFSKLIKLKEDLVELDLHNNDIGNMSGKMLLSALQARKEKKWSGVGLRVSEKLDKDLFAALLKAGKKVKKKKGKKKKKKS